MGVFEDVTITWKGEEYTVPSNRILPMIAKIEDIISLTELQEMAEGRPRFSKLAQAYGAVLRHAGVRADDDEIYKGLFADGGMGGIEAINNLLLMMIPQDLIEGEAGEKKDETASQ